MKVSSSSSSTSSLGNTALSGFGGLVSGLDRDSLIEQLTSGTQQKVTEQKQNLTRNEWKQEAYRDITDKVLDFEDNYLMFSSGTSMKDPGFFSKNVITAEGDEDATKYVKASGTSDLTGYVKLNGVKQLATAATLISSTKGGATAVTTKGNLLSEIKSSNLTGKSIEFGTWNETDGKFEVKSTFKFPTTFIDTVDGKETKKTIDYTMSDKNELARELNLAIEQSDEGASIGTGDGTSLKFTYDADSDALKIDTSGLGSDAAKYAIRDTSSALSALGLDKSALKDASKGISIDDFNSNVKDFSASSVSSRKIENYLADNDLTVTYGSTTRTVDLLTTEQRDAIAAKTYADDQEKLDDIASYIQENIGKQFGTGKISVAAGSDGSLSFEAVDGSTSFSLNADSEVLANLGITKNASNKLSLYSSLYANREKLGFDADMTEDEMNEALKDFSINGTKIEGITSGTSLSRLMTKINENSATGVKATYMSSKGAFVLLSTKTGAGRDIDLGGSDSAASKIFGGDGSTFTAGQDAILSYSLGSATQEITSDTNTFNVEGLSVTVSGTFGYEKDADGNLTGKIDTSQNVTFSAAANVDKTTEQVKKFIDAYNEIVKAVNTQVTTKPASGYDPLTDDQEDEMTEKQIEEWNKKAKEGILNGESTIRDFGSSLQSVLSKFLMQGVNYKDLEDIGITMSSDTYDGGTLTLDEEKFKKAMTNEPEKVSSIIADSGSRKGLASVIEETLTPYATRFATRNGGSYGRLVEEAGSTKLPLSLQNNALYKSTNDINELLDSLKSKLKTEQNRYLKQFTALETTIQDLNTQSGYLSGMMS